MRRRLALGALTLGSLALMLVLAPMPPRAEASDALSLVKQASEVYAKEVRGVVGFRALIDSQISAPIFNQKTRTEAFVIHQDGIPVRLVMKRLLTNGKPESQERVESQEAQSNANFRDGKGFFKPPYDARYMGAYTFAFEDCAGCADGMTAIRFTSAVKDDQHGKGVMILDAAKRVREVRYIPNVFPPSVTRASLTLTRDEVGQDLVGIRSLKADYHGSRGPIKGSFALDQRNEGFRRYASLEEAIAQAGKP